MSAFWEDYEVTGSLTAASPSQAINNQGAGTVSFQLLGTWTGTCTFEVNDDQGASPTWVAVPALKLGTSTFATTTTGTGIFCIPTSACRQWRVRFSTPTGGTVVVTARATAANLFSYVAAVLGTVTVDTEMPPAALLDDTLNPVTTTAVPTIGIVVQGVTQGGTGAVSTVKAHAGGNDTRGATINALCVNGYHYIYNGSSWDRVRGAAAASNTAGTGLLGVGPMVWDGAAFQLLKGKTDGTQTIGGFTAIPTATLTRPANVTAYASGDEMTDTGGLILQFAACGRANAGTGLICGLQITNSQNAATKATGELRLYDTTSTPAVDNLAFDASDTVNDTLVATIPFTTGSDGLTGTGGNCVYDISGLNIPFKCASADTVLYGRVILKSAYTSPANSDTWKFKLRLLQD